LTEIEEEKKEILLRLILERIIETKVR
jgi:hypothetical protein